MGCIIFGLVECVSSFLCEDLVGFIVEYYGFECMIVVVVGVVDYDVILVQVQVMFLYLVVWFCMVCELVCWQGVEIWCVKKLEQVYFVLVFEGLGYLDLDFYVVQIWILVLGGGMFLWLFQKLCEEKGLCYLIFVQFGFYDDIGMVMIYVGILGDQVVDLVNLMVDEICCLVEDMIEVEIVCVCVQLKVGLLMGLESFMGQVECMVWLLVIWGCVVDFVEVVVCIDVVIICDVCDYVVWLIQNVWFVLVLYGLVKLVFMCDWLVERFVV